MSIGKVSNSPSIQKVSWQNVRLQVKAVNIDLFEIIEQLSPNSEYTLYKARYPYGYESVKQGQFVFLLDDNLNNEVKDDINYNIGSNPCGLVLSNCFETFISMEEHTISYGLIHPGNIFGTWRILNPTTSQHPAFLWNINAGARSLIMLPKISVTNKFAHLKKYLGIDLDIPKNLLDHGKVFQQIASSPEFKNSWNTETLYFGKKWFDMLNDKEWIYFYNYLFKKTWNSSEFWRNEAIWNVVFSLAQNRQNLRPNPYLADTVKHILAMSVGAYPGFAPAIDDSVAPVSRLHELFCDIYVLNDYAPIIMQPTNFSLTGKNRPIYYSLEYPTTVSFSPKSRKSSNKITDLIEIKHILKKYLLELSKKTLNLQGTLLDEVPKKINYDFFHSKDLVSDGIKAVDEIMDDDPFLNAELNKFKPRSFPLNSAFLKGCIRISAS